MFQGEKIKKVQSNLEEIERFFGSATSVKSVEARKHIEGLRGILYREKEELCPAGKVKVKTS